MLQEIPILLSYVKNIIRGDYRYIRFFWDHFMTGWSEVDLWSLDVPLAKHILPQLKAFRALEAGYPGSLTQEKWNAILDKMIFAFEKTIESNGCSFSDFDDEIAEGLKLFGLYYRDLWC